MGKKNFEIKIDKSTHLLVLDAKWHELFKNRKPLRIQILEKELNELLKRQGKLTNELKEYQGLKKKMMDEIVQNMGGTYDDNDKKARRKLDSNRNYIEQINKKLVNHEKELSGIPDKINEKNKLLVSATMNSFYLTMLKKKERAAELENTVIELKAKIQSTILERDEAKEEHQRLYGYIHDVVGPSIIEQYDRYFIGDKND
jgi:DNA repair exonuclease SbcCD ATPase subunit